MEYIAVHKYKSLQAWLLYLQIYMDTLASS